MLSSEASNAYYSHFGCLKQSIFVNDAQCLDSDGMVYIRQNLKEYLPTSFFHIYHSVLFSQVMSNNRQQMSSRNVEYRHLMNAYTNEQGNVDATTFNKICAAHIIHLCDNSGQQIESLVCGFASYIDFAVHESSGGMAATVLATAVMDRYINGKFEESGVRYAPHSVFQLFTITYSYARLRTDPKSDLRFWPRIPNIDYACLGEKEQQLYSVMQMTGHMSRETFMETHQELVDTYNEVQWARVPWGLRSLKKRLGPNAFSPTIQGSPIKIRKSLARALTPRLHSQPKLEKDQSQEIF